MRVLVADQDTANRQQLVNAIKSWGHDVEEALSDREVVTLCGKKCPDLVFVDENLSGQSGLEIARQIRQTGGHALWVPIVLMAKELSDESLLKTIEAGIDDVLSKPVIEFRVKLKVNSAKRMQEMKDEVFNVAHQLVVENQSLQTMMSNQDVLTGLNNSISFDQNIEKEFKAFTKDKKPLSLVYLNLDFFRLYNEKHGAQEGDAVMRKVAEAIKKSAPQQNCFIARIVGDTFAMLLKDTTGEDAFKAGEVVKQAIADLNIPNADSGCSDRITVSFGVATATEKSGMEKPFDLKDAADFGLYKAKHSGRNKGFLVSETEAINQ